MNNKNRKREKESPAIQCNRKAECMIIHSDNLGTEDLSYIEKTAGGKNSNSSGPDY